MRYGKKWLVRAAYTPRLLDSTLPCLPRILAILNSPFSIHHSARLFAANQLKCLFMNHLHVSMTVANQTRSRLVKVSQGIFMFRALQQWINFTPTPGRILAQPPLDATNASPLPSSAVHGEGAGKSRGGGDKRHPAQRARKFCSFHRPASGA